jgi:hypothetical protein
VEEIKLLAQFGLGGVIAAMIFYYYRQDRLESEKRFTDLGLNFRQIVEANTEALTEIKVALNTGRKPS